MHQKNTKNIIVGVDFSNYSKLVVREAQELAKKLKLKITYVYVFKDTQILDEKDEINKPKMNLHYKNEICQRYSLKDKENIIIRYGKPHEEIIKVAKEYKHPLIMIGHRGHNAFMKFFLGSTAERLALLSPFPVWIHRGNNTVVPKKIFLPCDLSSRSENTIAQIEPLRKAFQATTEPFYVIQEPIPSLDYQMYSLIYEQTMKIEERKVRLFRKKHPLLKTKKALGNMFSRIQERSKSFDLIALSPRNHKKGIPMFGSVTTHLLRSSQKPVLILP